LTVEVTIEHLGHQHTSGTLKAHERPWFEFLAGVHEGARDARAGIWGCGIRLRTFEQQTLHGAATRHAVAEQARGEHAGVVDDEEIAATQNRRQIGHARVPNASIRSIENE
jgi:hypothetical protein